MYDTLNLAKSGFHICMKAKHAVSLAKKYMINNCLLYELCYGLLATV